MGQLKLVVGSDHAGQGLKQLIADHLLTFGHTVRDVGYSGSGSVDYSDFAAKACELVNDGSCTMGIVVCGTGLGVSMAANAIAGIRAALCCNEFMVRMARAHNDANVLCLGERVIGPGTALGCVDTFLSTPFAAGRHAPRITKLMALKDRV